MKRTRSVAATGAVVAVLVGCGVQGVEADDSAFDGLPKDVVQEALALPQLQSNLSSEPEATQRSLAQGAVRNIIFCRDEHRAYDEWRATGVAPELSPLASANELLEPSNTAMERDWQRVSEVLRSGDISLLRTSLTQEGSCGQWVPSVPGDPSSPTIAQAVQATE